MRTVSFCPTSQLFCQKCKNRNILLMKLPTPTSQVSRSCRARPQATKQFLKDFTPSAEPHLRP